MSWERTTEEYEDRRTIYRNFQGVPQSVVMRVISERDLVKWQVYIEDTFFITIEKLSDFRIPIATGAAESIEDAKKFCEEAFSRINDGTMRIPQVEEVYARNMYDAISDYMDNLDWNIKSYRIFNINGRDRTAYVDIKLSNKPLQLYRIELDFAKSQMHLELVQREYEDPAMYGES